MIIEMLVGLELLGLAIYITNCEAVRTYVSTGKLSDRWVVANDIVGMAVRHPYPHDSITNTLVCLGGGGYDRG